MNRISRRTALIQMGRAAAAFSIAAACSPIQQAATPTVLPSVAATPKRGGSMTLAMIFPIQTTNPHPTSPNTLVWKEAVFNLLVNLDAKQQPVPDLAESWTTSSDGLTFAFKLRQGVKFHNGKEFTADDAKWNIDYAKDAKSLAQSGRDLATVTATAKSTYELELKSTVVLPQIFALLAGVPIIEPASDVLKAVVGTGPFKIESFVPGDQLRLVRNDAYWRTGYPLLDRYTIKVVPDNSTLVVNLESGAADVISSPPYSEARRLASGATKVVTQAGAGNYDFLISASKPPFNDKRVRQALSLAIDRKRIVDATLFGQSEPTYVVYPKSSPVYDRALDVGEFSLEKAKQLLATAGHANGFSMTILTSSSTASELTQQVQIVQSDLAKIGITATIQDMEANAWVTAIRGKTFEMVAHFYGFGDQDPGLLFTATPFNPAANASNFVSPQYDAAVKAAQVERDPTKRLSLYKDLMNFLKDESFVLPLANKPVQYGLRANVQGFKNGYLGAPDFEEVWRE